VAQRERGTEVTWLACSAARAAGRARGGGERRESGGGERLQFQLEWQRLQRRVESQWLQPRAVEVLERDDWGEVGGLARIHFRGGPLARSGGDSITTTITTTTTSRDGGVGVSSSSGGGDGGGGVGVGVGVGRSGRLRGRRRGGWAVARHAHAPRGLAGRLRAPPL
jgi:hypothetical protein